MVDKSVKQKAKTEPFSFEKSERHGECNKGFLIKVAFKLTLVIVVAVVVVASVTSCQKNYFSKVVKSREKSYFCCVSTCNKGATRYSNRGMNVRKSIFIKICN